MSQKVLGQVLKIENEPAELLIASLSDLNHEHILSGTHCRDELVDRISKEDPATVDGLLSAENAVHLCNAYCGEPGLSHDISHLTWHEARFIVPVTLYIVTHIMREPKSIEEISRVSSIQVEDIRQAYRRILLWDWLIQPNMLGPLSGDSVQDLLESLPSPTYRERSNGFWRSWNDLEHHWNPTNPNQLQELCNQFSDELDHAGALRGISLQIAGKIRARLYLAGLSPLIVVAVSLYMASHLASLSGWSIRQISEVVGISEGTIRSI